MNIFEITIQRQAGNGWPVVVEQSQPGVFLPIRSEGVLQLDQAELISQPTPRDYGTLLGQALFRDEIRDAFVRARTESDDNLRVLLFVEDDGLKTLRWERLCAPLNGRWDFLALDQRALFSLYLPSLTDRRFPPIGRRDLRALILVANPKGLDDYGLISFDEATTVTSVLAALADIPSDVLATVPGAVGLPTLNTLCERITAERYTLLHVVAHGKYLKRRGETVLYLANADNQVEPVPGTRLIERLGRLRGARGLPHFAFLSTCESARPEAEGALGGLAQRLVRELGMPAVVAMTEKVSVRTAEALAEKFYQQLREHGEVDRALVEATAGLAEQYDITVPALYSRLGGRPLFSDTLDRELTDREIEFGLTRLGELLAERAPVLRPRFTEQADRLRGTLGAEALALSKANRREREEALAEISQICEEALDLHFKALALGQEPPVYDGRCPFRGLYPFRFEDREFFFGREALIKRLQQKLAEHPFLAVLGSSGCGKSSLVLAGLIPALQEQTPGLQMLDMTPGDDPIARLEAALAKLKTPNPKPETRNSEPRTPNAILVVDQFEELFTLCLDEEERQRFIARLLSLAESQSVVMTMRADFWGECAPYPKLKEVMLARQELIAPMNTAELRRAMELQAGKVGLRFEADLSNTILDDVRGEPGAMPLLQHALLELWQRRHGRWLRAAEYRALGGVKQAIAGTAEKIYRALSPTEQTQMRNIFVRLTRLDEDAVQGEERRDTRRRVGLEELITAESDRTATVALVNRLADARLVVTGVNPTTNRQEVEVAHEALIREWSTLRQWLDEDREGLLIQRQLGRAAAQWARSDHDPSYLYQGKRLATAREWAKTNPGRLNQQEQAYLNASVAAQRRAQAKRVGTGLALVLVPALVALLVMFLFKIGPFALPEIAWSDPEFTGTWVTALAWGSDGTMYAGLDSDGTQQVARSTDGGQTWDYLSVQGDSARSILPAQAGVIYVALEGTGLFRSQDGGSSWVAIDGNLPAEDVRALAISPQGTLYAGDYSQQARGIYASNDGGETWSPLADAPQPLRVRSLNWANDRLLVGTRAGLWQWTPDSQWAELLPADAGIILEVVQDQAGEAQFAGGLGGIFALWDGTPLSDEIISSLAVVPGDVPVFIAGTVDGSLVWWHSDFSATELLADVIELEWTGPVSAIHVDPKDPGQIWVGTADGLYLGDARDWLKTYGK